MDKDVFANVMYFVFPYMTKEDIGNVEEAYSFLLKCAKTAIGGKNLYCFTIDLIVLNDLFHLGFKHKDYGQFLKAIPNFGLTFTDVNVKADFRHGNFCNENLLNNVMINLKSNCNMSDIVKEIPLMAMIPYPSGFLIQISLLSFMPYHITSNFERDNLFWINYEERYWFIRNYEDICRADSLIIFCRHNKHLKCENLLKSLSDWPLFPKIKIWYAVVDEITACRNQYFKEHCRMSTDFVFIFMKHRPYKSYLKIINSDCDNEEKIREVLIELRHKVIAMPGSIAFMHICQSRVKDFYELDKTIFNEIFPDVIFFLREFEQNALVANNSFYFTIDQITLNYYLYYGFKHTNVGDFLKLIPALGFSFSNINRGAKLGHGRLCNETEKFYFIINLKTYYCPFLLENDDRYFMFHLPKEKSLDITIFSFMPYYITTRYNNESVNAIDKKIEFNNSWLKEIKENYPAVDQSQLLIVFCRFKCFNKYKRCFRSLMRCDSNNAEKIKDSYISFKNEINLRARSLAFLHVSNFRAAELFALDVSMFKEVFPEIKLFPIYGFRSCYGSNFAEFHLIGTILKEETFHKITALLILSYD
ncbi:hypothetical protein M0802_005896 [Mischocyttarus mexicanus]|nr:hypothetical protein M0802_005896 [Mischocyttarus mexicanus]